EPVDAIISSPPYPGVYNYLAAAFEDQGMVVGAGTGLSGAGQAPAENAGGHDFLHSLSAFQGFDKEAMAEAFNPSQELGSKQLSRSSGSLQDFVEAWAVQQREWLSAAYGNLNPGGTATVMIGNGDDEEENGIDCLESTLDAAKAVGFEVLATATIESCADAAHRTKGMLRTEHMVHLRKP
ncbi:unnamed protein product, partial [Polarella glacialis]